ncbi:unnamed protein product, partial [Polarella glacialis]
IKRAYRLLALKHHPDRLAQADGLGGLDSEASAANTAWRDATERFQELQAAYEAVSPLNRRRYDLGVVGLVSLRTDLMDACEAGDSKRVRRLLADSADVHATDVTGRTALLFAAGAASLEILRALLQHHADVGVRNCAGHTCVMFAVGAGLKVDSPKAVERALQHLEAVRLLLDEGAPVDGATGYGLTALMLACASGLQA